MTPEQIRILSIEDHPVFRQGLATIIETEPNMVLVAAANGGGGDDFPKQFGLDFEFEQD